MQRKFSEPNTYIDGLPSKDRQDLLYDDVEMSELTATVRMHTGQAGPRCQNFDACHSGPKRGGVPVTCRAMSAEI